MSNTHNEIGLLNADGSVTPYGSTGGGGGGASTADAVSYSNTTSGLPATEVQTAIDVIDAEVDGIINVYGSKNLISYPYDMTTKVDSGVTYTDNGDGSITVSGTASARSDFWFHQSVNESALYLPNGTYKLSGCPSGGAVATGYHILLSYNDPSNVEISVNDIGDGETFTLNGSYGDANGARISIRIIIRDATSIPTPITFKPMIRDARIKDDTFVPYAMTNRELTEKFAVENLATGIDLKSYDSSGNRYVFPSDGYLQVATSGANKIVRLNVQGNDMNVGFYFCVTSIDDTLISNCIFVKKGMSVYVLDATATSYYVFFKALQ